MDNYHYLFWYPEPSKRRHFVQHNIHTPMKSSRCTAPLSKHSDSVRKLREKYESGAFNGAETPKIVAVRQCILKIYTG